MGLLLIDGFDMYNGTGTNTGLTAGWTATGNFGSVSLAAGRFSGQAVHFAGSGSGSDIARLRSFTAQSSVGGGFAYRTNDVSQQQWFFWLRSGTTYQFSIQARSTGAISVYRATGLGSGTLLGSSAVSILTVSSWHYIEYELVIHATLGVVNIWVDGTQVIALTGQNTSNAATADTVGIGMESGASGSVNCDFDDFYLTDGSHLGERRVETLRAAADTAQKDWSPNSGIDNFSRVNETLVDGDTSYVETATVGNRDLYTLGPLSSTPSIIDAVNVVSFAEKTDATTRQIYNSVQSSGTNSDGTAISLAASYGRFDRIMPTDPNGGGAWTASRVNGLQIGPKLAA